MLSLSKDSGSVSSADGVRYFGVSRIRLDDNRKNDLLICLVQVRRDHL